MRLNSPMVMVAPSSNVAMTVSSGRVGMGIWAHAEARHTNRGILRNFMTGKSSVYHAASLAPADGTGVRARFSTLHLDAAAAFFEVVGGLLPRGVADLNVVVHDRAGR